MTEIIDNQSKTIDRKDFMKQVGIGFGAIMLLNCLQSCSSEKEIPDPVNPGGVSGKVDVSINITDSNKTALGTKGGFIVLADSKIIVARTLDDKWIAVSSACTHEGVTLDYRKDSNDFVCSRHGSVFKADGTVAKAPANAALKKFSTTFSANTNMLRIFE